MKFTTKMEETHTAQFFCYKNKPNLGTVRNSLVFPLCFIFLNLAILKKIPSSNYF